MTYFWRNSVASWHLDELGSVRGRNADVAVVTKQSIRPTWETRRKTPLAWEHRSPNQDAQTQPAIMVTSRSSKSGT